MKLRKWMAMLAIVASGSAVFQTATCNEQVTTISSLVTAGGVLYIVSEILQD